MIRSIPCNCYHSAEDHINLNDGEMPFFSWCRYSEIGQCPCDYFSPMTNLQYLEYKYDQKYPDKI